MSKQEVFFFVSWKGERKRREKYDVRLIKIKLCQQNRGRVVKGNVSYEKTTTTKKNRTQLNDHRRGRTCNLLINRMGTKLLSS